MLGFSESMEKINPQIPVGIDDKLEYPRIAKYSGLRGKMWIRHTAAKHQPVQTNASQQ